MNAEYRRETDHIADGLDRVIEDLEKIDGALADYGTLAASPAVDLDALDYAFVRLMENCNAIDRLVMRVRHTADAIDRRRTADA